MELGGIGCRIRSGMTGLRIFEALRVISSQTTKLDAHFDVWVRKEEGMATILVTGGAGYIGSHTVVELQQ